ncbi:glutathione S-transferase rho [Megalops cyprinoides]|uniref:glutathione S-transferase rho n=1 Tax=Megalops cyprinoides TaxID=118141 RepID=UPI001864C212|nr:glutathione S-transferase rho [Megalops cyprinoides]
MAKDMTLFWGSGSPPCWRVMIALEEKKLQGYQQKLLSFEKMEHKSKEVMELNPRGQLPAFKHGNHILNESYAACLYLESQFKSQGPQLIPDSPEEQAMVYQRMFEAQTLQQKLSDVIYYTWRVPEAERHESALKRNKETLTAELQLWEQYLQKMEAGSYLAGKSFSMADVVAVPVVAYAVRFGLSQDRYPRLGQYYSLVKERPSVKASWPPHWLENPQGMDTLKDL